MKKRSDFRESVPGPQSRVPIPQAQESKLHSKNCSSPEAVRGKKKSENKYKHRKEKDKAMTRSK